MFRIWLITIYFILKNLICCRFHINLQTDEGDDPSNISFHFNPRQNQGEVIRNSMIDGGWGDEETDGPDFPFGPKDSFEIRIVCTEWRYVVSILCVLDVVSYLFIVDLGFQNTARPNCSV